MSETEITERRYLIRVYGDSLGMPRASAGVSYEKTYAELTSESIGKHLSGRIHLYNRCIGGRGIAALFKEFGMDSIYFGHPGGDVLILQLGIVDCAPRPVPHWLRRIIGRFPSGARGPIVAFLHNNRARMLNAGLRFRTTGPVKFLNIYTKWLTAALKDFDRIYVFTILPTTPAVEARSPGLSAAIEKYNDLIKKAVDALGADNIFILDAYARVREEPQGVEKYILAEDGHHMTVAGHRLFSRMIFEQERAGFEVKISE